MIDKRGRFVPQPLQPRLRKYTDKLNGPYILKSRCWLWTSAHVGDKGDRPVLRLNNVQRRVSHLVLELAGMQRPSEAHQAAHRCDNPRCIRLAHLWWATPKENMEDASRKGRMSYPKHQQARENMKRASRAHFEKPGALEKRRAQNKAVMATVEWQQRHLAGVLAYHLSKRARLSPDAS